MNWVDELCKIRRIAQMMVDAIDRVMDDDMDCLDELRYFLHMAGTDIADAMKSEGAIPIAVMFVNRNYEHVIRCVEGRLE